MIPDFEWRKGDQEPVFAQRLTDDAGNPVDLSGATLALIMRSLASAEPVALHAPVQAVTPPDDSVPCQIQWAPDSVDTAAIDAGGYLGNWSIVFADGTPMTSPTSGYLWIEVEESLTDSQLTVGVRPPNRQVAGLMRARTKVPGGKEQGVFVDGPATAATRPTATQVDGLIDDALDEVLGKVQPIDATAVPGSAYNAPGSRYERRVRGAVALYAAILIETSYYPEQVRSGQSPVTVYQQLYDSRIRALIAEGETGAAEGMGQGASGGGDAPADAAWGGFPPGIGGLIGNSTVWSPCA